jgi:2-C-methyl-D-erythritol 4-phosphate cytidylyltransferase
MVLHTLAAFAAVSQIRRTLVVVAPGDRFLQPGSSVTWVVADRGGDTRAATVANGLAVLRSLGAADGDWVLVHDAARCLVTPAQIQALITACESDEVGGLLALKLPDTLKQEREGRVTATLERGDKWLAQTPQMFRLGLLQRALHEAGTQVTDESSAIEALGLAPRLVSGSAQNFKVTYPEDFALAEAVLRARADAAGSAG